MIKLYSVFVSLKDVHLVGEGAGARLKGGSRDSEGVGGCTLEQNNIIWILILSIFILLGPKILYERVCPSVSRSQTHSRNFFFVFLISSKIKNRELTVKYRIFPC